MARPTVHLIVSTGLATLQWIRTGRLAPTLAPYLSGFLVDGDHLVDLIRYRRNGGKHQRQVVLPLHGWEYLLALLLAERLLGWRLAGGLVLGYLAHLLIDQYTNQITHPLTYFLTFRWRRSWDSRLFDHPDEGDIAWLREPITGIWKHL